MPSGVLRSDAGNERGSSRVWKSSSDVVTTVRTSVPPTTDAATSRYRLCRQTSTVVPESLSSRSSSRSRFIGLIETAMPPAFHVADQPDDELRHVLQVHRHPVAALQPVVEQRDRERVGHRVELAVGDAPVEVAEGVAVGVARHGRLEHGQRRR